jgi:hypothetical protein
MISRVDKRMLGFDLDSWNDILVVSLAVAAIAAVFVLLSTYTVIQLQKAQEIATKQEFDRYKIEAGREVSKAQERIVELQNSNIEAQRALESERIERLLLQKKFSWRHLDDNQLRRIIKVLLPYPGLPFDCQIADAESLNLLTEISKVLLAVNWIAKSSHAGPVVIRATNGIAVGVFLGTKLTISDSAASESDFGPAARALANALTSEGIEATAESDPNETVSNPIIHIKVGSKPAF